MIYHTSPIPKPSDEGLLIVQKKELQLFRNSDIQQQQPHSSTITPRPEPLKQNQRENKEKETKVQVTIRVAPSN